MEADRAVHSCTVCYAGLLQMRSCLSSYSISSSIREYEASHSSQIPGGLVLGGSIDEALVLDHIGDHQLSMSDLVDVCHEASRVSIRQYLAGRTALQLESRVVIALRYRCTSAVHHCVSRRIDVMSAFDIFGTVGTALSIVVMMHHIVKKRLPRERLCDLMQVIVETEELYQTTTQEGLCIDKDSAAAYDLRISGYVSCLRVSGSRIVSTSVSLRSEAEDLQARCLPVKNVFQQYWIMTRGLTREIECLTLHACRFRSFIRVLRHSKHATEGWALRRRGIGRRLGLTHEFTSHLERIVSLHNKGHPRKRPYELDRYLTPPEVGGPRIPEPLDCNIILADLLNKLSSNPLDILNYEDSFLIILENMPTYPSAAAV
ncbi:hypothetical protein DENSPDRAFT_700141 [Dentipellis sp. KUC8613]|nr:hypothetical protein DENSPDRAFT_700141 [Dentipellis sp. KUC8613]